MPKDYSCPCGQMSVTFPGGNRVQLKGGFLYGNARSIYKCKDLTCSGQKRVGYDVEFLDQEGNVYHKPDVTKSGTTKAKPKKKTKKKKDTWEWNFIE